MPKRARKGSQKSTKTDEDIHDEDPHEAESTHGDTTYDDVKVICFGM